MNTVALSMKEAVKYLGFFTLVMLFSGWVLGSAKELEPISLISKSVLMTGLPVAVALTLFLVLTDIVEKARGREMKGDEIFLIPLIIASLILAMML